MFTLMILFFILVYIILAVLFVKLIKKFTKRKLYKWLAVAFVILLPTWDVVLGIIAYPLACMFIPKTAIYETAEVEGIYYEGDYKNYIFDLSDGTTRVGLDNLDLEKGYKYIESLVTEKSHLRNKTNISPLFYRCVPLPRSPQKSDYLPIQCIPVSDIQSGYLVKVRKIKLGISEIHFMKIKNRSTGKLMAEYNEVVLWPFFPFFDWLKWYDSVGTRVSHCPAISRFYDFQYDVLKLKNN